MPKKKKVGSRRQYSDEFKAEAVQMLLDGHSAEPVASRLGLSGTSSFRSRQKCSASRSKTQLSRLAFRKPAMLAVA